jgi:ribosomal protein S1
MASNIDITSDKVDSVASDEAWEEVLQRLGIGQVVQGAVEATKPYGAFFDIGEGVPAFLDVLEAPAEPLEIGQRIWLKIVQFADWNRQIRVALTDDRPHASPNPSE